MNRQILISWIAVVGSFFLGTIFFQEENYLAFDIIWRISIIIFVIKIGEYKLSITTYQLIFLLTIFLIGMLLSHWLNPSVGILASAIAVVFAPLMEEIYFRGWLINQIEGTKNRKVIISSILFGLYHLKNMLLLPPGALVYQVCYAGFFIGPLFAWVFFRTGSVYHTIALHSINNLIAETITRRLFPRLVKN